MRNKVQQQCMVCQVPLTKRQLDRGDDADVRVEENDKDESRQRTEVRFISCERITIFPLTKNTSSAHTSHCKVTHLTIQTFFDQGLCIGRYIGVNINAL